MTLYQQGDCLLKTDTIPKSAKEVAGLTLVESAVTGHKHQAFGAVKMLEHGDTKYLRAVEPFEVRHEEHHTLTIPTGEYRLDAVREYDHFTEEARAVAD